MQTYPKSRLIDIYKSCFQGRLRWECIVNTIEGMELHLPHYSEDHRYIDSILSKGKYAVSHSPEFREAYHPHYRIVRRDIFEQSIKPLIQ